MDIDIDFFDRNKILDIIPHHVAMRIQKGEEVKHNTGVYFTSIPHNPFTNLATIDYEEAEKRGYFKIDFLNVSMYEGVRDEEHLVSLLKEPNWDLLTYQEIVDQLFHINGHFNIVNKLKPQSIEQLAAVLAIIRPAKRHLADSDWATIFSEIWTKSETGEYQWKKSHAFAYAAAVVVQLNLLTEQSQNINV
jgi:DNA polymerase III alpha subunit